MANQHLGFIAFAYCAAFILLGGLALFVLLDRQAQRRRLDALQPGARPDETGRG